LPPYTVPTEGTRMEWSDYIAGKTVAIVGPAQPTHDQSAEIDAHDVVIRMGWVAADRLHPWYGRKCNVAFFNLAASRYWSGSGRADDALATLDWVLVKGERGITDVTNCRLILKPEGVNANQVPILLYDLSHFVPGPVSVFGADFYWDPKFVYSDEYLQVTSEAKPAMQGATVADRLNGHDWEKQRAVCRDAMARLNVIGDRRFLDVMALTDSEYMDGMMAAYPGLTC
jgi:hypothetical protein